MELGTKFRLLEQLKVLTHLLACPKCIASAVTLVLKKRLCTPTVSRFAHFGVKSGSGRPALIPNSLCCSTLVTLRTMLILSIKVRSI